MRMKPEILINFDSVFIARQEVQRPQYMSRKEWLEFWEEVEAYSKGYQDGMESAS